MLVFPFLAVELLTIDRYGKIRLKGYIIVAGSHVVSRPESPQACSLLIILYKPNVGS